MNEDKKLEILSRFSDALQIEGMDDLADSLNVCFDESWYDMEPDQIWREQAEQISGGYELPEDLQIFSSAEPDWDFAELSLRSY